MKGTNKSEALRGRRDQVGCRDQERLHGRGGWCAKPLAFITTQQAWNVGMTSLTFTYGKQRW